MEGKKHRFQVGIDITEKKKKGSVDSCHLLCLKDPIYKKHDLKPCDVTLG